MAGIIKTVIATALYWFGLNSFLVGIAYKNLHGSLPARIAGGISLMTGVWLLWKGVTQTYRNMFEKENSIHNNRLY